MSLNHHVEGNDVVLVATCAVNEPLTGVETPTDATTATFTRKQVFPDRTEQTDTYRFGVDTEVTNPAVGTYLCKVPINDPCRERWRFQGTGACKAAVEHAFDVDASVVV